MLVAIQGFRGSFHDEAAHRFYGKDITLLECVSFRDVCTAVAVGTADKGLMAIENTIAGAILPNYSLLREFGMQISGDIIHRIVHNFMVVRGTSLHTISAVESHPMALLQCQAFLGQYPHWKHVVSDDTALSADRIRKHNITTTGVIAPRGAAELYDLEILAEGIETDRQNFTRFLAIERKNIFINRHSIDDITHYTIPTKTSPRALTATIVIQADRDPFSLSTALGILRDYDMACGAIHSIPIIGKPFVYAICLVTTFGTYRQLTEVSDTMRRNNISMECLGIYPTAELPNSPIPKT